ncbi:ABC transporter ATP-binding protein [Eilatimonas milleporae]|uniref:Putative ABC transport system ATP-binding protein n=1 Tax=Eilatimonas milleporae TaxID=911205 RepID=A0A3M0CGF5_9PROT|nr:ABC transporter ATP-binding protein [Eilatimonas milleporae]RMB08674.1 putative ABC transport system ATP-binding protein [Eilatimonas milleporae]
MQDQIELKQVGHYFETASQRIDLFRDLSQTIVPGGIQAIVGPSGAGKSSLLSIAAGLEAPRTGAVSITIGGRPVDARALRARSGFIFQQFHLMPELDAIGNLALPLRLKGDRHAFDVAARWLEKIGLEKRARHRPDQLSGGEQQRIAIARAFVGNPRFVFADEPTGNLDERTAAAVTDLMVGFARDSGCAMVIVTHSRRLAACADTRLRLTAGRLEALQ